MSVKDKGDVFGWVTAFCSRCEEKFDIGEMVTGEGRDYVRPVSQGNSICDMCFVDGDLPNAYADRSEWLTSLKVGGTD